MKRALLIFFLLAAGGSGELLDRVAVTIGNQVITENELLDEIRLTAFLNNEPANFGEKSRREAADRLIEQKLVLREIDLGRYPPGSPGDADAILEKLEKTRAKSGGDFDRQLAAAGLTMKQLREHLLWGLTLSHFVDLRFRPAIQITRDDVQKFYAEKILPESKSGQKPNLADVRAQIYQTLTAERSDQQMDAWLKDAKTRAHIEIHKEAFEDWK